MSASERGTEEAILICAAGSRAGFGQPFSRLIRARALEEAFILDIRCDSDCCFVSHA